MASSSWTMLRAVGVLELLFITSIIIFDFYRTRKADKESNVNKASITKWAKAYKILTHVYVMFVCIHSLGVVLSQNKVYFFGITNSIGCLYRTDINGTAHQIHKSVLYVLLITRLMASYSGSMHQYSLKKVIIPFYVFIALHFIYAEVIALTRTTEQTQYDESSISSCNYIPQSGLAAIIYLFWDIVISVIVMVLFLRPLHKLLKNSTGGSKANEQYFMSIITKTTVLACWAITSTFALIVVYLVLNIWNVLLLDNIINIIAVVLMNRVHDDLYQKLCGKCGRCCLCLCCCAYGRTINETNLIKSIETDNKEKEKEKSAPQESTTTGNTSVTSITSNVSNTSNTPNAKTVQSVASTPANQSTTNTTIKVVSNPTDIR